MTKQDGLNQLEQKFPIRKPKQGSPFSPYFTELAKFVGCPVIVTTCDGLSLEGVCKGIEPNHCHMILMTDTEKMVVRSFRMIARLRNQEAK